MDISIYEFTKQKLLSHGIEKTEEGKFILRDKKLFSLFIKLERASRLNCFDTVQETVLEIEDYLITAKKRHLVIFAYMYLFFSYRTPNVTERDELLENGDIKKSYIYKRNVTDEDIAISAWSRIKFEKSADYFFKVVYKTK